MSHTRRFPYGEAAWHMSDASAPFEEFDHLSYGIARGVGGVSPPDGVSHGREVALATVDAVGWGGRVASGVAPDRSRDGCHYEGDDDDEGDRDFERPSDLQDGGEHVEGEGANEGRSDGHYDEEDETQQISILDVEASAIENDAFRRVISSGPHMQLVLMSLLPGEEIGEEVHHDTDQFIRVEEGTGLFVIDGQVTDATPGMAMLVPAGHYHNVINSSHDARLSLYTLYSPPEHPDGLVQLHNPRFM